MKPEHSILDDIYEFVGRFVIFPNEASRVAHTLWIAHTYLLEAFYTTPRLLIQAPTKQCGKSRLVKVTRLLVRNEDYQIIPTASSLYTSIELSDTVPTILIDEINRLYQGKDTHEITAVLEAGFEQDGTVSRTEMKPARHIERFKVFAPVALIGIDKGNVPDTVVDRCIQINLQKRLSYEKVESFRPKRHKPEATDLKGRLEAWAIKVLPRANEMNDPIFPAGIEDREADKWEPLFVVADVADVAAVAEGCGAWGVRARQAALELLGLEQKEESTDYSQLALFHLREILELSVDDRFKTENVLKELHAISDAPWSDFAYGKPLSARGLAKLLKPFGIKPKDIKFEGKAMKGYFRSDFDDAFQRYLLPRPTETGATSATGATPATDVAITSGMTFEKYREARGLPAPVWA